jgi:putative ABC transport system permease protein
LAGTLLFAAFAGLAVILANVGISASWPTQSAARAREIGIRVALGPQITDVVRMVVVEGMIPTLTGLSIGIVARWPRPDSDNPNLPVFRPAIP